MPHQVTIKPSNHAFTVNDGETVLDAALREGIIIAYGCRNGACGTCKGKLARGSLDYGTYQEHALPDAERAAGMALFCQARPLTDLVIECREIARRQGHPDQDAAVPRAEDGAGRARRDAAAAEAARERAAAVPRRPVHRHPACATACAAASRWPIRRTTTTFLELHLRNYGGPFSEHVFTRMKEKDILRFEGPFGTFFLREDGAKPIVFLASGTGFAPIKAMIEHALHAGIERPMTLYWGCRVRSDLYLNELAERWSTEHGIRYVPVLSEALPADEWTGRTGFVHRAVMEDSAGSLRGTRSTPAARRPWSKRRTGTSPRSAACRRRSSSRIPSRLPCPQQRRDG